MTLWALNVFSDGVVLGVRHFVYRYLLSDSASEERNGLSSDNTATANVVFARYRKCVTGPKTRLSD